MRKYYKYTLNLVVLNIVSVLLFIATLLPVLKIVINYIEGDEKNLAIVFIFYLIWIISHELLHGIGHLVCGSKINDLSFGAALEKGVLFCLIRKEIGKRQILISLLFPFFFIGVLTYVVGILINNPLLLILSIANISGAVGDLIMFFDFINLKGDITYIEPGDGTSFYLMSSNPINRKMFGLKFVEDGVYDSNMFNNSSKKIDISKTSYILFIIFILLSILMFFL